MIQRLRTASGCVLLVHGVTHLSNHALALRPVPAAEAVLELLSGVWCWPVRG